MQIWLLMLLSVAETIEYHEPSNYREVVSREHLALWSIAHVNLMSSARMKA